MDTRQGNIYSSEEEAIRAKVAKEFLAEVEPITEELLKITSGPMKGRVYKRTSTGIQRVLEAED
jgi:hypothetical protein